MLDGEVVEDPEDDLETAEDDIETGTKTCSIVPNTEGDKTDEGFEMAEADPDLTEEEGLNLEGGEVTEAPDEELESIGQSEPENIVSDLIDIVITDNIM